MLLFRKIAFTALHYQLSVLLSNAKSIQDCVELSPSTWCIKKATRTLEIAHDIAIVCKVELISFPHDVYLQPIVMAVQEWGGDFANAIDVDSRDLVP